MTRYFAPSRSEFAVPLIQLVVTFLLKFLEADSRNRLRYVTLRYVRECSQNIKVLAHSFHCCPECSESPIMKGGTLKMWLLEVCLPMFYAAHSIRSAPSHVIHSTPCIRSVPSHVIQSTPCIKSVPPRVIQKILCIKSVTPHVIHSTPRIRIVPPRVIYSTPCIRSVPSNVIHSTPCIRSVPSHVLRSTLHNLCICLWRIYIRSYCNWQLVSIERSCERFTVDHARLLRFGRQLFLWPQLVLYS
jgi:ribosomal protein L37AE/L43A